MPYAVILKDRAGNASPLLPCNIHCDGTELEIDAELAYEYIKSSHTTQIVDDGDIVSEHKVLGYSFYGDTIINGVKASRCREYLVVISNAS